MFAVIFIGLVVCVSAAFAYLFMTFVSVAFETGTPSGAARAELRPGEGRIGSPSASRTNPTAPRSVACPWHDRGPVPVTAGEALRLATYVRMGFSRSEADKLFDRAEENSLAIARGEFSVMHSTYCPLVSAAENCLAHAVRPQCCVTAQEKDLVTLDPYAHGVKTPNSTQGKRYELNAALAIALGEPNAAVRSAEGEDLFADCPPCSLN
jgi:hypothetical protein